MPAEMHYASPNSHYAAIFGRLAFRFVYLFSCRYYDILRHSRCQPFFFFFVHCTFALKILQLLRCFASHISLLSDCFFIIFITSFVISIADNDFALSLLVIRHYFHDYDYDIPASPAAPASASAIRGICRCADALLAAASYRRRARPPAAADTFCLAAISPCSFSLILLPLLDIISWHITISPFHYFLICHRFDILILRLMIYILLSIRHCIIPRHCHFRLSPLSFSPLPRFSPFLADMKPLAIIFFRLADIFQLRWWLPLAISFSIFISLTPLPHFHNISWLFHIIVYWLSFHTPVAEMLCAVFRLDISPSLRWIFLLSRLILMIFRAISASRRRFSSPPQLPQLCFRRGRRCLLRRAAISAAEFLPAAAAASCRMLLSWLSPAFSW